MTVDETLMCSFQVCKLPIVNRLAHKFCNLFRNFPF
ncbi:unnamed protein product [Cylicostephanus goldi]|uniref:Uncharacterized protein n=1 Tax=Cylicostephanus goldi TaxID=71465 RepID=A0A3P6SR98_CYLGO|nr:unnamed protein product [Cylicostephanus goldi]